LSELIGSLPLLADGLKSAGEAVAAIVATYSAVKATLLWRHRRTSERLLRDRKGAELFGEDEFEQAMAYYVWPKCQDTDPTLGDDLVLSPSAKPLLATVDEFLSSKTGDRYMILLADSGMGKTSFLLNYYVRHWRSRRRRGRFDLVVIPLGLDRADTAIEGIGEKANTVIFLDALDEDARAIQDGAGRLAEIARMTQEFRRVVVTCRTHFFVSEASVPIETGVRRYGAVKAGGRREREFKHFYLAPLDDRQIRMFARKVFPWRPGQRRRILGMVRRIPQLTARPMILDHARELLAAKKQLENLHEVYEAIVEGWLQREKTQGLVRDIAPLRRFCEELALDLIKNRDSRGGERIPHQDLKPLADEFGVPLAAWQLRVRSLLNRDAMGNYKFAHRSIMEYLAVRRLLRSETSSEPYEEAHWTEMMRRFLASMASAEMTERGRTHFDVSILPPRALPLGNVRPRLRLRRTPREIGTEEVVREILEAGIWDPGANPAGGAGRDLRSLRVNSGETVVLDQFTGLLWQGGGSHPVTADQAAAVVSAMNSRRWGGYSDWRLPTIVEALSLMCPLKYESVKRPFIVDPFPDRPTEVWTIDTHEPDRWVVNYNRAGWGLLPPYRSSFVRAVRL
jgi:hypothetical protein